MAAVAPQQSGDGEWKNQLQLPAKDMRYKTEVSMRMRGIAWRRGLNLSPTELIISINISHTYGGRNSLQILENLP
jgi:hypothetical protein